MAIDHGKPYDPDFICQDDYEWLTETGPYASSRVAIIRRGLNKRRDAVLAARKNTSHALLQAYQHTPHSVAVLALETVKEALTAQLCNLDFRLSLLDAYPRAGYSRQGTSLLIGAQILALPHPYELERGEEGTPW